MGRKILDYYHLYSPKSVNFVTLSLDFRSFKEVQEQPDSVPLRKSFVSFLDSRSIFLCTWNLKASPGWGLVPVSCGDVVRGRDPHVSSTRRSQMSVGTATVPLLLSSFSRSMFWICQSLHLHSLPSTALSLRSLCGESVSVSPSTHWCSLCRPSFFTDPPENLWCSLFNCSSHSHLFWSLWLQRSYVIWFPSK